jgi:hypothetical protein
MGMQNIFGRGEEKCIHGFGEKMWRKEPACKTKVLSGRIILKWNLKDTGRKGVGWISVAQDRDKWQAVMNTVMNHWDSALNSTCETSSLFKGG